MTCDDLRGTVRVNGTVCVSLSTVICAPARFDAKARSTVFAVIFTIFGVGEPARIRRGEIDLEEDEVAVIGDRELTARTRRRVVRVRVAAGVRRVRAVLQDHAPREASGRFDAVLRIRGAAAEVDHVADVVVREIGGRSRSSPRAACCPPGSTTLDEPVTRNGSLTVSVAVLLPAVVY